MHFCAFYLNRVVLGLDFWPSPKSSLRASALRAYACFATLGPELVGRPLVALLRHQTNSLKTKKNHIKNYRRKLMFECTLTNKHSSWAIIAFNYVLEKGNKARTHFSNKWH